jgi:ubiquinone/menaquinone biosynthesis C-methylase UbiE
MLCGRNEHNDPEIPMATTVFNEKKYKKLNDPQRLVDLPPAFFKEKLGDLEVKTIADIGAGTAFFSRAFTSLYPNADIYAVDISEFMVGYIQTHVEPDYPAIKALLIKDSRVPLDTGSIDLIIMINLHHEIPDHDKMLSECHRLLKSGGKIMISDWKKQDTGRGPTLESRVDPGTVKAQLQRNGFTGTSIDETLKNNFLVIATKA